MLYRNDRLSDLIGFGRADAFRLAVDLSLFLLSELRLTSNNRKPAFSLAYALEELAFRQPDLVLDAVPEALLATQIDPPHVEYVYYSDVMPLDLADLARRIRQKIADLPLLAA